VFQRVPHGAKVLRYPPSQYQVPFETTPERIAIRDR